MLQKYGDQQISSISVFRAPVGGSSLMVKVLNGLSTKNIPYDTLFHAGLLITLNGVRIRVEKNEVIGIDDNYTLKPQTETKEVPHNKQLTLNELLNNTINKVGREKVFKYSAFQLNCQCFTKDVLESNGLYRYSCIRVSALGRSHKKCKRLCTDFRERGYEYISIYQ